MHDFHENGGNSFQKQYVKIIQSREAAFWGLSWKRQGGNDQLRESVERIGSWDIVAEFLKKKREVYQLDFWRCTTPLREPF